jgi:hypothetical protein
MNRKLMMALLTTGFLAGAVATPFAAESGAPGAAATPGAATPGAGRPGPTVPNAAAPNAAAPSTMGSAPRNPGVNPALRGDPECSGQISGSPRKSGAGPNC